MRQNNTQPRACDRCHSIKVRCRWPEGVPSCQRCRRLGHECITARAVMKLGRPPGRSSASSSIGTTPATVPSPRSPLHRASAVSVLHNMWEYQDLTGSEAQLLERTIGSDDHLASFLVGESFCESHRRVLISHYVTASSIVKDSLVAVATSYLGDSKDRAATYKRASSALRTLRNLRVTTEEELSQCLVLGAALVTFAFKVRVSDTRAITNQTLCLVKAQYDALSSIHPDSQVFMTCLIVSDLFSCLMSSRAPVVRYKPPVEDGYVDRFVGLCTTLLPLLHDICELSHAHFCSGNVAPESMHGALAEVEHDVRQWQPVVPPDFATRFASAEVTNMLCQAEVLQTTGLLVMHRISNPFGTQDDKGQALSAVILRLLSKAYIFTQRTVKCVDVGFVFACFELVDLYERNYWLAQADILINYSDAYRSYIKGLVVGFWNMRDAGEIQHYHDIQRLDSDDLHDAGEKSPLSTPSSIGLSIGD